MKIPKHARAQATGDDYVRITCGRRRWWQAILDRDHSSIRLSRRTFDRAGDAAEYKRKVLERLND